MVKVLKSSTKTTDFKARGDEDIEILNCHNVLKICFLSFFLFDCACVGEI